MMAAIGGSTRSRRRSRRESWRAQLNEAADETCALNSATNFLAGALRGERERQVAREKLRNKQLGARARNKVRALNFALTANLVDDDARGMFNNLRQTAAAI